MAPAEALRAAAALLADPAKHATEVMARDMDGLPCDPLARRARCWCTYGALRVSAGTRRAYDAALPHLHDAAFTLFDTSPDEVNDTFGAEISVGLLLYAAALADRATVH
ncbi:hypothetical protein [Methylobacterium sp. CCH5-D2]|uniref:DUF6197 family protein n=1 Tax=Methylobacterium sp. CCH5-D2 TaxID=1768765 RepID=UPI0008298F64|nr:hypothetical protein [Methylobacterium sp. CCH5-D2]